MESTVVGRLRLEVRGGTLDSVGSKHATPIAIGDAPVVIGRSKGRTLVVDDKLVSKVHAELVATENGVRLRDLGSRNGTFAAVVATARNLEAVMSTSNSRRCPPQVTLA